MRDFCGHGLGRVFHDAPTILHYVEQKYDVTLAPGMLFTIEPMINLGRPQVKVLSDGWTAVTRDRSLSAQFEHSVGVTEAGGRGLHDVAQGLRQAAIRDRLTDDRPARGERSGEAGAAALRRAPGTPAGALRGGRRDAMRITSCSSSSCSGPFPRADVKPLAKRLIARFGSFAEVLTAQPDRLREVEGVGQAVAIDLKVVEAAARRLSRGAVGKRPVLSSWSAVLDYCRTRDGVRDDGALPPPVPGQAQRADRRRGAGDRDRRPHAGLPAARSSGGRSNSRPRP